VADAPPFPPPLPPFAWADGATIDASASGAPPFTPLEPLEEGAEHEEEDEEEEEETEEETEEEEEEACAGTAVAIAAAAVGGGTDGEQRGTSPAMSSGSDVSVSNHPSLGCVYSSSVSPQML
jgi:hypothetical protein